MILRQHRLQILVTTALVAALGIILLVHGLGARHLIERTTSAGCPSPQPQCAGLDRELERRYRQLVLTLVYLSLAPGVIGAFWGAPLLAREHERRTTEIAWAQSVPRRRWILAKLLTLGSILAVLGVGLGVMVEAWLHVFRGLDLAGVPPNPSLMPIRGASPAAWWLCGFALGAAWGAALRKTLPAMVITMASFFGLLFVLNNVAVDSVTKAFGNAMFGSLATDQADYIAVLVLISLACATLAVILALRRDA